jgi:hypothetical protein
MDRLKSTEHDYNIHLWISHIKECRASGLTVPEWCSQNGIGVKNYYYWMRKVKREAIDSIPHADVSLLPVIKTETPVFSKISVPPVVTSSDAAVTIHINGITVDIRDGTSDATIKSALQAIRSLC